MSYLEQLQQHNTDLQGLINKANALPDAGSGGGGGSYDTCTVNIRTADGSYTINKIAYATVNANGEIEQVLNSTTTNSHNMTCLCGSVIVVQMNSYMQETISNATSLGWIGNAFTRVYGITGTKGETATIVIQPAGGGSN